MAKLFERLSELRDLINEAEAEARMEPYWMVHRFGRQSGPANKVHHSFEDAYAEAERLARKERDRFVILQAHTMIEPFEPLVITVETIGEYPASGVLYPEPLDPEQKDLSLKVSIPPHPRFIRCCGDPDCVVCFVSTEDAPEELDPCPAQESGRMVDCTCGDLKQIAVPDHVATRGMYRP